MSEQSLWYTRCPTPTPLGLAVRLGYLDALLSKEGVGLASLQDSPDPAIRASHFDHRLEWSFRQGGNIPPIHARASGRETRLVAINWIDEFQALISLPERGLRSTQDLLGHRIGLPRKSAAIVDFQRATSLKGVLSALELEGIGREQVVFVDIETDAPELLGYPEQLKRKLPYAAEFKALIRGEIDAFFVKGAEGLAIAHQFGAQILTQTGFADSARIRINNGTPRLLTVDRRLSEERPDLVGLLLEAIDQAAQWASSHPDETRRFVAQEIGVSEEAVAAAFGPHLHEKFGSGIDEQGLDAVGYFKDFLLQEGFIAADFSVRDWLHGHKS